jgi:pimeloyl-ACP methyl ester carboxylesterase
MDAWVTVNGMRVHYLQSGAGTAEPPLVMVHGWAGAAADWAPLLKVLPAGIRGIAVDLPGSGRSDKPDAPYDLPWFMDFLHAFCRAVGAATITLAGHSLGGLFAVHFAARFPSVAQKLILVDPYGLRGERGRWERLSHLRPIVQLAFAMNRRAFIQRAIRLRVLHRRDPDLVQAATDSTASSILGREGARALSRVTYHLIGRLHVDGLLPGLSQPTLLLWGENDRLLAPGWAARYSALLPRVTVQTISEAGHMPMFERPREVAEKIERFLGG